MNKENYRKALDQVRASDELKSKTFEKIVDKKSNKNYIKYLSVVAVIIIVCTAIFSRPKENNVTNIAINQQTNVETRKNDLPRFKNIEELKNVLDGNQMSSRNIYQKETVLLDSAEIKSNGVTREESVNDYSKTNIQVENVDEADIVKTDGEYIYYVAGEKVYIVEANNLEIKSRIDYSNNEEEDYSPSELYINGNKLIVLGTYYEHTTNNNRYDEEDNIVRDYISSTSNILAKAIIYDISNKENPTIAREVALDGNYINSRMIDENIYFISIKRPNYYPQIKDEEILPIVQDTARAEKTKRLDCIDIAYFKDTNNYNYMIVGGFNINNNDEVNIESFFGASDEIYASENNLYITQMAYNEDYSFNNSKTIIYKFNLSNSHISMQCKGEVKGYLNNQFSMDEYEGNLRIATTVYNEKDNTSNQLFILDENLQQIGKIENLAKGEQIYAVRFMGKFGYIVTFEQVDPLFVIDLQDPTNPEVKGELKIPGYSSYLHPYDETHVIGIGYNTKSNGYGGITNDNMKVSMFDVSDLENPKELFNISIGEDYTYSDIGYDHKVLFYNKNKNLIGFPLTYRGNQSKDDKNGFIILKIDLDNNEFEKYGEILQEIDYKTNIDRGIYIQDILYTLSESEIVSYDLNTIQKIKALKIEED